MEDGNTAAERERDALDAKAEMLLSTYGHAARNYLENEIDDGGVLIDYVDENDLARLLDLCYDVLRYGKEEADVASFEAKKIFDKAVEEFMEANFERALEEVQE